MTYLTIETRSLLIDTICNICRRLGIAADESNHRESLEKLPDVELEQKISNLIVSM